MTAVPSRFQSMRVLHLPSSFLPESVGGTEVYVDCLCRALAGQGVESAVAIHSTFNGAAGDLPYSVFRLPPCPVATRLQLYSRSANVDPPGYLELIKDWRPDLIHFHAVTLGAGPDHARVAQRLGIPYALTYHTPAMSCPRGTMLHLGQRPCDGQMDVFRCSSCVAQSRGLPAPFAAIAAFSPFAPNWMPDGPWIPRLALPGLLRHQFERMQELLGAASHIVACADWCRDVLMTNGVHAGRITVARQAVAGTSRIRELRLPLAKSGRIRLGYFGRICKIKGPDILLQAMRSLLKRNLEVECELAGPIQADEAAWFKGEIEAAGPRARHVGVLRGPDLPKWLESLDLLAIPSRWLETGPLTLLEAWDVGLPVIGADRGGIRDFMDAAGMQKLKFPAESPDGLADAVIRAMEWNEVRPRIVVRGFDELAGEMAAVYRRCSTKFTCEVAI